MMATGIRVIGITWGLPYLYHPDEPVNLAAINRMVAEGSSNPGFFAYPSLYYDLQAFVRAAHAWLGEHLGDTGAAHSLGQMRLQMMGSGLIFRNEGIIAARMVTVVLGVVAVAAVGWVTWLLAKDLRATALAIAGAGLQPVLVANSRWVTPDTLAGLTTGIALGFALLVCRRGSWLDYLFAGVAVGLAASSKYNAVLVAVALIAAHFARPNRRGALGRLSVALLVSLIVFLITTPSVLTDFDAFHAGVMSVLRHYGTGHVGVDGASFAPNVVWLWQGLGVAIALALVPFCTAQSRSRLLWVPSSFIASYILALSAPPVRFERNLIPLIVALIPLSAVGASVLFHRTVSSPRIFRALLFVVIFGSLVVGPLRRTAVDAFAATRDQQRESRAWLANHLPRGSRVVVESYAPFVDPDKYGVLRVPFILLEPGEAIDMRPNAILITRKGSGRFLDSDPPSPSAEAALRRLQSWACTRIDLDDGATTIFLADCSSA
jgi:hypothetical protein